MSKMVKIKCACGCGREKNVRFADVKRGWGRYFSKSCKAYHQTKMTGKGKPVQNISENVDWDIHPFSDEAFGQF